MNDEEGGVGIIKELVTSVSVPQQKTDNCMPVKYCTMRSRDRPALHPKAAKSKKVCSFLSDTSSAGGVVHITYLLLPPCNCLFDGGTFSSDEFLSQSLTRAAAEISVGS